MGSLLLFHYFCQAGFIFSCGWFFFSPVFFPLLLLRHYTPYRSHGRPSCYITYLPFSIVYFEFIVFLKKEKKKKMQNLHLFCSVPAVLMRDLMPRSTQMSSWTQQDPASTSLQVKCLPVVVCRDDSVLMLIGNFPCLCLIVTLVILTKWCKLRVKI